MGRPGHLPKYCWYYHPELVRDPVIKRRVLDKLKKFNTRSGVANKAAVELDYGTYQQGHSKEYSDDELAPLHAYACRVKQDDSPLRSIETWQGEAHNEGANNGPGAGVPDEQSSEGGEQQTSRSPADNRVE